MKSRFVLILMFIQLPLFGLSQSMPGIQKLITDIDSFYTRVNAEKVFFQTDRTVYSNQDTIWLKGYILDGSFSYSKLSGLIYIELSSDSGRVVLRKSIPVKWGICFGEIALNIQEYKQGTYSLRAYTNWMQNRPEQTFFKKELYINDIDEQAWIVRTEETVTGNKPHQNVEIRLQFTDINKMPVRLKQIQVKLINGNKVIGENILETDLNGKVSIKANIPEQKTASFKITAKEISKDGSGHQLNIPVNLGAMPLTDFKFMPEGGKLVAGILNYVGFKAIDINGFGIDVKGRVVDNAGKLIQTIKSSHKGMGSFSFIPNTGERYSARLFTANGESKLYPLPPVESSGIVMHIANQPDKDSLAVSIYGTEDILKDHELYSLIGLTGGKVCYAANFSFSKGIVRARLSKEKFRTGVTRFTLFNASKKPIVERLIYIDHDDALRINLIPNKKYYQPGDSIDLMIKVTDRDQNPVRGSFSIAVTDDDQVNADEGSCQIDSYMLLNSEVKGYVEEPDYYFSPVNIERFNDLDNLLLTQGWVGYSWEEVFDTKFEPAYRPESEFSVSGHLTRMGGKGIAGLPVMLLSTRKPVIIRDTLSDKAGRFVFKNLPRLDTADLLIQVKDKKGKMFEANVVVDEFKPAPVTASSHNIVKPWNVNTDSPTMINATRRIALSKVSDSILYGTNVRHLREVLIKGTKSVRGSHNLNGPGRADQVLNEKDMEKAGKTTLTELLYKMIKGFRPYYIYDKGIKFVFDGIDLDFFYNGQTEPNHFAYIEKNLDLFNAEDIRGIEVLYHNEYNGNYTLQYDPELMVGARSSWPAYVEITTWSGNGLFQRRKENSYLYRPLPVSWPKQFYIPKFNVKNHTLTDLKPTVFWEPNVLTGNDGTAHLSFYCKGIASNYTIVVQGSDLSRSVGYKLTKLIVK